MIEILKNATWEHMNCGEECCGNDDKLYSNILQALENAGMQPPNIRQSPEQWFRHSGEYGYDSAEWEEE